MTSLLLVGLSLFNAVPRPIVSFPIAPSGELFVGKYFPNDTGPKARLYNIDVGVEVSTDLIDIAGQRFFISYRDELIAGNDFSANVAFDPRMAHFYLIGGFRFNVLDKVNLAAYINHDCTHNIDRVPDSLKVVYNRVTFAAGTPGAFNNRNLASITNGEWFERLNGKLTYEWYPHDTMIDALNSTDLYHAFQLDASFDQPIYKNIYASARLYGYLTRIKPKPGVDPDSSYEPFWGYKFAPQIGVGVLRQHAALELYIRYWAAADVGDIGFHEPGRWPYVGLHLRFM